VTRKIVLLILGVAILGFAGLQLVPYGRDHTNPPITAEPAWPDAAARSLAARACFDCHSNESVWPWYSSVAPVSWLIQRDVEVGRSVLNFSEWDHPQPGIGEVAEVLGEGEMPPGFYRWMHRSANLTAAEMQALTQALAGLR
jgi:hypothetical protein